MECKKTPFYEPTKNDRLGASGSPLRNSKPPSLSTLVAWNITKAKETYPELDIKDAIATAQCRLEQVSDAHEIQAILSENRYTRYLACALLAWQQLGHRNVDSLCRFVENKKFEEECASKVASKRTPLNVESISQISKESTFAKAVENSSFYSNEMGPVIKLPVETKIVMRVTSGPVLRCKLDSKNPRVIPKNTIEKIEKACFRDSKCSAHLGELDTSINELKCRVSLLAHRESDRIELVERAEVAWRDLELGYQRRLQHIGEKLTDLDTQIKSAIIERTSYKEDCLSLSDQLEDLLGVIKEDKNRLDAVEKELYALACDRVTWSQACTKEDAVVAQQACRAAQLERDLTFKEEQERRYMQNIKSELESVGAITHEVERTLRIELNTMRGQLSIVSEQLLAEDAETVNMESILEGLRQEKMEMIEDLESCKMICDSQVQGLIDEIKSKSQELSEMNERVLECRCKVPVDASSEVKRTPSFAALCKCTSADSMKDSCSCESIRGRLMSDVLATLFGGLRTEMGTIVTQMSCQLLKCLEDTHNWDKVSVVKSNLKSYFSNLLVGELEIAIATSIENYHAKWVGTTCVDEAPPDAREAEIERRAKSMASQLAEQLFQQKSNELQQRAKDILTSGPPPCICQPHKTTVANADVQPTTLRFLLKNTRKPSFALSGSETPIYWHQAIQDVTELRQQVEDLKKESLKKADLKTVEDKFVKFMRRRRSQPKAGHSPLRNEEAERRERHGKKNVAVNHTMVLPCLAQNKLAFCNAAGRGSSAIYKAASCGATATNERNEGAGHGTLVYWYKAMQDVTHLCKQVEGLTKESLKKEDLKKMENKFTKIFQRISGSTPCARTDNLTGGNAVNKVIKNTQKLNRTVNHSGLHIFDNINKPTTAKMNQETGPQIKKKSKLFFKHRSDKTCTTKRDDNIYAVNMCLCNTKKEQQISKDPVCTKSFETSSNMKFQSKPINMNSFSQDISKRDSKQSHEQSCPSTCACLHTIPSTTSIDKLLVTLAKWKYDVDASDDKFMRKPTHDENVCLKSETNDNLQVKLQKNPTAKKHESLNYDQSSKHKIDLNESFVSKTVKNFENILTEKLSVNSTAAVKTIDSEYPGLKLQKKTSTIKHESLSDQSSMRKIDLKNIYANKTSGNLEKNSAISAVPIGTTESEYMGAINLDKSNEELFKSVNNTKKNKTTSYKFLNSSKYSFEKDLEAIIIERSRNKKEKSNEVSADQTNKQKHRKKEMIVLKNIPQIKEKLISHSREKETKSKLDNVKKNSNVIDGYQIKFIGVTLADANPPTKQKILNENGIDYFYDHNIVKHEKKLSDKKKPTRESDQNEAYTVKNNTVYRNVNIAEYSRLSNNMKKCCSFFYNKNDHDKCSNCDLDTCEINTCKISNQNEDYHKKTNKRYDYVEGTEANNEHGILKKTTGQDTYNKDVQPGKDLMSETYSNVHESEYPEESTLEGKDITENSRNTKANKNEPLEKDVLSCQCSVNFSEFKKFLDGNFGIQMSNKDGFSVDQSFKHSKNNDESCICCKNLSTDDLKDLEENAFHLLEEYLKKKLDEFKATHCSSLCIPAIEEEKLFMKILQQIKQVIADSTNQITCKCSTEGVKSQGSWSRAHGLLQEYLKMKIRKVQCSCLLAEDNKNSILPNVLDKVNNLIEYDFKRLKNICRCKNDPDYQKNAKTIKANISKKENKDATGKNLNTQGSDQSLNKSEDDCECSDTSFGSKLNQNNEKLDQATVETNGKNLKLKGDPKYDPIRGEANQGQATVEANGTNVYKQDSAPKYDQIRGKANQGQAILETNGKTLKMETDAPKYDSIRSNVKQGQATETVEITGTNISTLASGHSLNKYKDCECSETINDALSAKFNKNNVNLGQATVETPVENVNTHASDRLFDQYEHCYCDKKSVAQLLSTKFNQNNENKYETVGITREQKIPTGSYFNNSACKCVGKYGEAININVANKGTDFLTQSFTNDNNTKNVSYMINANTMTSVKNSRQTSECVSCNLEQKNVPNIGNTIVCCCDNSLGTCVCSKSITLKADTGMISNIWDKSMADETYSKKLSHTMNYLPENIKINAKMQVDMSEDVVLINSLKKNAIVDSTFQECQTAISSSNADELFLLKKSIENVPKTNAKTNTLDDIMSAGTESRANEVEHDDNLNKNKPFLKGAYSVQSFNKLAKLECTCEKVPICHVKMFVENIETKLVNAKCTCDSLIPKVCPVHSTKCVHRTS